MKQILTKKFIMANKGCYTRKQVDTLFPTDTTLTELLNLDFPLKDKFWFVIIKLATPQEQKQIAVGAANIVWPIFEAVFPNHRIQRDNITSLNEYYKLIGEGNDWEGKKAAYYAICASYFAYSNCDIIINKANFAASFCVNAANRSKNLEYETKLLDFLKDFCLNSK